jgi:hypothetical protein
VTAVLYANPPLTLIFAWLMFDEPMPISILMGLAWNSAECHMRVLAIKQHGQRGARRLPAELQALAARIGRN